MSIRKIYLEPTNACNLNCEMCYRRSWSEPVKTFSREMEARIVKQMQGIETLGEVVIGGIGEPTSYTGLPGLLQAFPGVHLTLTSNLVVLTDPVREAILEHVDELIISIDGNARTFQSVRHVPLTTVLDNMKSLKQGYALGKGRGLKLVVQMVISKKNLHEMPEVLALAKEFGASRIIFSHLLPVEQKEAGQILYTLYQNEELRKCFETMRIQAMRKGLDSHFPDYRIKTERHCRFVEKDALMVAANGDVVPCYRFSHDGREFVLGREKHLCKKSFGNVLQENLMEIYMKPEYVRFRQDVLHGQHPSCLDCDLQEGCDLARDNALDCYGLSPSCGDCLWARNIVYCV